MKIAATIALFCAGGGLARYYLSGWVYGLLGRAFPYGTLVVNVIGAYCIGLIMELGLCSTMLSGSLRIGLTVGFWGADHLLHLQLRNLQAAGGWPVYRCVYQRAGQCGGLSAVYLAGYRDRAVTGVIPIPYQGAIFVGIVGYSST